MSIQEDLQKLKTLDKETFDAIEHSYCCCSDYYQCDYSTWPDYLKEEFGDRVQGCIQRRVANWPDGYFLLEQDGDFWRCEIHLGDRATAVYSESRIRQPAEAAMKAFVMALEVSP
ncbi:MAG TPA: hypothetical protein VN455_11215 [Methanotrichaceae archaeon]|nr:hypothetical protein [Methanotrichaceae archaeon]